MRRLPDWLKGYVAYNNYNEAPNEFHFWTGVGTIAGALQRKVWLDMGYFQWTPNFFIILVAPPGVATKSTTIGVGRKFLSTLPSLHLGPASITWQALIEALQEATEEIPIGAEFHAQSCLTFFISELGTCLDFTDRRLVDVLVDIWDGQQLVWERRTLTGGLTGAVNPWINIIGCTTPAWLVENAQRSTMEGGFSARCMWLFANAKRTYVPYPRLMIPHANKELADALTHDLAEIHKLRGEFTLTEDAVAYGSQWYQELSARMGTASTELLNNFYAREQTHVHKLAMVLSAAKRDDLVITREELEAAVKIVEASIPGLVSVLSQVSANPDMEAASEVVHIVRAEGRIRRSELYQRFFSRMSSKQFAELVESAVNAELVHLEQAGSTVWVVAGKGA